MERNMLEEVPFNGTYSKDYQMKTSTTESHDIGFVTINSKEAKAMMEQNSDAIILDVRRQNEYDAAHIPNAILLPNETISKDSVSKTGLNPDDTILTYCHSGIRSKQAAQKLADMGYTNVYNFGAITSWPYEVESAN